MSQSYLPYMSPQPRRFTFPADPRTVFTNRPNFVVPQAFAMPARGADYRNFPRQSSMQYFPGPNAAQYAPAPVPILINPNPPEPSYSADETQMNPLEALSYPSNFKNQISYGTTSLPRTPTAEEMSKQVAGLLTFPLSYGKTGFIPSGLKALVRIPNAINPTRFPGLKGPFNRYLNAVENPTSRFSNPISRFLVRPYLFYQVPAKTYQGLAWAFEGGVIDPLVDAGLIENPPRTLEQSYATIPQNYRDRLEYSQNYANQLLDAGVVGSELMMPHPLYDTMIPMSEWRELYERGPGAFQQLTPSQEIAGRRPGFITSWGVAAPRTAMSGPVYGATKAFPLSNSFSSTPIRGLDYIEGIR